MWEGCPHRHLTDEDSEAYGYPTRAIVHALPLPQESVHVAGPVSPLTCYCE